MKVENFDLAIKLILKKVLLQKTGKQASVFLINSLRKSAVGSAMNTGRVTAGQQAKKIDRDFGFDVNLAISG